MKTPFDTVVEAIAVAGYHNHRLEGHSDLLSDGIVEDLKAHCASLRSDLESGAVRVWKNVSSPGDRERKVDLLVGEPKSGDLPDMKRCRIAVENKSVITAHRNRTNRFDDLTKIVSAVQGEQPEALLIATVLIGTATRYLNVPDRLHPFFRDREEEFDATVLPRLSSGDETLITDFPFAVSPNRPSEPKATLELFRTLPTRGSAQTHKQAFDSVLLVPVRVDNVHEPSVDRANTLGIDVDVEYLAFLERTCKAYTARWHM